MVLPGGPGGRVRRRQHIFGPTSIREWALLFLSKTGVWRHRTLPLVSRGPGVIRGEYVGELRLPASAPVGPRLRRQQLMIPGSGFGGSARLPPTIRHYVVTNTYQAQPKPEAGKPQAEANRACRALSVSTTLPSG